MGRVLLVYATREGQTEKIARRIREILQAEGHRVDIFNAKDKKLAALALEDFDYCLFGASMHGGGLERELHDFLKRHRWELPNRPRALFVVLLSAAATDPELRAHSLANARNRIVAKLAVPFEDIELIAGALRYSQYDRPMKWLMRRIARAAGGDTDTSRDYEYTDWEQVERFTRSLVIEARDAGA